MLSAKAAMRDPISPLAIIAVPTIEAGYSEHDFVIEAVACGVVEFVELGSCGEPFCTGRSLDCLNTRSPSMVRARFTSGIAFDHGSSAVFLASDLQSFVDLANPKQLYCAIFKVVRNALIFVGVVPEGTAMRISHMPVISFPMSIKIVKTMPRQTTPVNMRVIETENAIEA